MKIIVNIQSFTDVITNSSSSVFIMTDPEYYINNVPEDCLNIEQIDLDWIRRNVYEWELIFRALGVDKNEISEEYKINENSCWTYWRTPEEEVWQTWVDTNQDKLADLYGKYYVDIEDHFENAWEITEEAYGDSIASESRH